MSEPSPLQAIKSAIDAIETARRRIQSLVDDLRADFDKFGQWENLSIHDIQGNAKTTISPSPVVTNAIHMDALRARLLQFVQDVKCYQADKEQIADLLRSASAEDRAAAIRLYPGVAAICEQYAAFVRVGSR